LMQIVLPNILVLGFGFPFNSLFPDFYLKRLGIPSRSEWRSTAQEDAGEGPAVPRKAQAPLLHQESAITYQHLTPGKEKPMKVLAINSSPRSERESKTELMLSHLDKGMREAGADVEVVHLRKKKINYCIGCFTCWTKTPGICLHKDDMTNELFPKWAGSDLVIYATPLYHFTINASMKAFIERTLPALEPFFEDHGDRTGHPFRFRHPSVVMLSVAGFPEESAFDQLSSWARFVFSKSLVAEIYRGGAEVMTLPFLEEKAKDILDAVTQAGRELVKYMKVDPATMARIKQPISGDVTFLHKMGNLMWKTCIAEGLTPREFVEKGLAPRPDSIETFLAIMPMGFNPHAAGGVRAVIQFDFSGDVEGSCHFKIEDNKIAAFPGNADKPDLTIKTPFSLWMDIMNGKADGQKMFMEQKYKVLGDISLLMKMNQLFRK
jgi:NAD(P)H-dependent FMN reductase